MLGVQELVIILLIVVLVFGAKRIPEIMSGLGHGIKSFKKAIDGEDTPEIRSGAGTSPSLSQKPNESASISSDKS